MLETPEDADESQATHYAALTILDSKCQALLAVASVLLGLNGLVPATSPRSAIVVALNAVVALVFLSAALLCLFVIWLDWTPTRSLVRKRTLAYGTAVILTGVGLTLVALLTLAVLDTRVAFLAPAR